MNPTPYNAGEAGMVSNDLGGLIKQQRLSIPLTLQELATKAGISVSHLGRIERGERFPSARVLRRIAAPLGFEENEIFTLAGYLSAPSPAVAEATPAYNTTRHLDPFVARLLSQEPVEIQRCVVGLLSIIKSIALNVSNDASVKNRQ